MIRSSEERSDFGLCICNSLPILLFKVNEFVRNLLTILRLFTLFDGLACGSNLVTRILFLDL